MGNRHGGQGRCVSCRFTPSHISLTAQEVNDTTETQRQWEKIKSLKGALATSEAEIARLEGDIKRLEKAMKDTTECLRNILHDLEVTNGD